MRMTGEKSVRIRPDVLEKYIAAQPKYSRKGLKYMNQKQLIAKRHPKTSSKTEEEPPPCHPI